MRRTRAERRHHHRRMKNKVKKYSIVTAWPEEYHDLRAKKFAETRTPCSCDACGNPRHSLMSKGERLPMCERRMDEHFKHEIVELFED